MRNPPLNQKLKVLGRVFDCKVFAQEAQENWEDFVGRVNDWLEDNPGWGVIESDGPGHRVYLARKDDEGVKA